MPPRTSFRQRIIDDIRADIASGKLKPGDKLPTYEEFAATYRCSVTPVKEALRILEALGLVEGQQGKGTYVAEQPSPG